MNIGRSDIDWKSLSHDEIDIIIAERIEADNRRIKKQTVERNLKEPGIFLNV